MTIPFNYDPLGSSRKGGPAPEPIFYEDSNVGEISPNSIPMPSFMKYYIRYDLDFPIKGTIQLTHIILHKIITTQDNVYVGGGYDINADGQKRENIGFLSVEPLEHAGEHSNVVCTVKDVFSIPHECGPGYSIIEPSVTPSSGSYNQLSQFSRNDDDTYKLLTSIATNNIKKGYVNPIQRDPTLVEHITTSPDQKQHCMLYTTMYRENLPTIISTRYKFIPA